MPSQLNFLDLMWWENKRLWYVNLSSSVGHFPVETLSPGVQWQRHEADHSPPTSVEVKKKWIYTSTSPIHLHGVPGLENRDYGHRGSDHATPLYPQKLALTSPTSGGRSVGIVGSRTKATGLVSMNCTHFPVTVLYLKYILYWINVMT
jgi:hypothetical protein